MEDIDIENLDFDIYNREIYKEEEENIYKSTKYEITSTNNLDAFKEYKKKINDWVKEDKEKNKIYQKNEEKTDLPAKKYKY